MISAVKLICSQLLNVNVVLGIIFIISMCRFSVLHHFIASGVLSDPAIPRFYSVHDVDNTSDREPICDKFKVESERFTTAARQFAPTAAWHKTSEDDLAIYRQTVTDNLRSVEIPYSARLCRHVNSCNVAPQMALNIYIYIYIYIYISREFTIRIQT